jgi:hypothetical protein
MSRQKGLTQARQREAVASKQYHCAICKVSCRDTASLRLHNKTKRHQKKMEMGDDDFHCAPCAVSFRFLSNFNQHKKSKAHIQKTAC